MYYTTQRSPIGTLTLASDGENLVGLWTENQKYHGGGVLESMKEKSDLPIFDKTKNWLDKYFAGKSPAITELPLAPSGSEFRQKVWNILRKIPYGQTVTYGYIAKMVGIKSGQAVGGAVGHNPLSIVIPCHRVVGSNGSLTGYAGGLGTKVQLLEIEGVDVSKFSAPLNKQ